MMVDKTLQAQLSDLLSSESGMTQLVGLMYNLSSCYSIGAYEKLKTTESGDSLTATIKTNWYGDNTFAKTVGDDVGILAIAYYGTQKQYYEPEYTSAYIGYSSLITLGKTNDVDITMKAYNYIPARLYIKLNDDYAYDSSYTNSNGYVCIDRAIPAFSNTVLNADESLIASVLDDNVVSTYISKGYLFDKFECSYMSGFGVANVDLCLKTSSDQPQESTDAQIDIDLNIPTETLSVIAEVDEDGIVTLIAEDSANTDYKEYTWRIDGKDLGLGENQAEFFFDAINDLHYESGDVISILLMATDENDRVHSCTVQVELQ